MKVHWLFSRRFKERRVKIVNPETADLTTPTDPASPRCSRCSQVASSIKTTRFVSLQHTHPHTHVRCTLHATSHFMCGWGTCLNISTGVCIFLTLFRFGRLLCSVVLACCAVPAPSLEASRVGNGTYLKNNPLDSSRSDRKSQVTGNRSKEAVGENSWNILNAILGYKYR